MSTKFSKFFRRAFVAAVAALMWIVFIYLLAAFTAAEFDFKAWAGEGRFCVAALMGIGALIMLNVVYNKVDDYLLFTNY